MITALIVFLITYLFIGLRQIPRLHINRPAGALVGAVLMIVLGVLTLDQAFSAIDLHTLLLIALATSSNIGSVMTVTGNPQNMLIGSVANLIVVQQARKRVEIGFMEYFRVGAFITVITIAIGIMVLGIEIKPANGAETFAVERPGIQLTVTIAPPGAHVASRTFNIVLVCDTNASRTTGLQGFRRLKANEAALFLFESPEAVTFWMGSVAFPIDIVFISSNKKVVRVYPDCKPGSRDVYPSGEPAAWVIETAAGSGIRVGDRVRTEGSRNQGRNRE